MITEDSVKQALQTVKYPGFSRDVVSFGIVKKIAVSGAAVNVEMDLNSSNREAAQQIKQESERAIRALGANSVWVEVRTQATAAGAPAGDANPFLKSSWNETEQAKLFATDPTRAKQLQADAAGK